MFEIFTEGITLLNSISCLAFFTTVGLFFCGLPICRQIWKRKDTKEISGAPFVMGVIGGSCWWAYGYLKADQTVLYVTSTQIVLYSSYLIFYFFMSKNKLKCSLKVAAPVVVCAVLYAGVHFFGQKVHHPLGAICICLNVADFIAPLAGIKYVIRKHSTQTLPMPLCIANFLVSSEWCIYGLLKQDFYLILPNGIGSVCAAGQLILFLLLPRKTGLRSPLAKLITFITICGNDTEADVEADVAKVMPQESKGTVSKHRWSDRVMANVAEEIENVLQKCSVKDQFAYSDTLNGSYDSTIHSNTSVMLTTDEDYLKPIHKDESPDESVSEKNIRILKRQLSIRLNGDSARSLPKVALKRTISAPNITSSEQKNAFIEP